MDKFSELKAAALAATPGRVGDRIDGSGSIKYECVGYDGSVVLRTDHKNMEYGFVGDNSDADELFFRRCAPDVILSALAELEKSQQRIAELEREVSDWQRRSEHFVSRFNAAFKSNEELRAKLATPVRLPRPACVYADHSYPAYSRNQVEEILTSAGMCFTVEGDE
ncbi:ead/Ea22-like family protein [Serratia ficaria]|uniref:ead/Ea22-like family protein n=1 Tax=Serratia ficaria TaxID=61651 RepID=UPI0021793417|nr:ead/Ea22-like family protein [Serratia ficaria]CAI1140393.1 Uncharacterised protein [Serratia ficaria]CAI2515497.1 Uncharacterised protein [Serratia ficaria]